MFKKYTFCLILDNQRVCGERVHAWTPPLSHQIKTRTNQSCAAIKKINWYPQGDLFYEVVY